jgi:sec-independent protein translocase protein TatA
VVAFFGNFGAMEMVVVGIVAILVFGGRLPEVMRNMGRAYARFRQGMNEMSRPIREELRKVQSSATARPPVAPPPTPYPVGTPPEPISTTPEPEAAPPTPSGAADEPPPV